MTKHTPGPWKTDLWKYENSTREVLTIQTEKDAVAQMCQLWRGGDDCSAEVAANARLIAAAPELLAAAIAILDGERNLTDGGSYLEYRDLENAVEAATRSASCTCGAPSYGPVPPYCQEHDGDYSSFLAANNCD